MRGKLRKSDNLSCGDFDSTDEFWVCCVEVSQTFCPFTVSPFDYEVLKLVE